MTRGLLLIGATALVLAAPVGAQSMQGMQGMSGMSMPGMKMPPAKKKPVAKPAARKTGKTPSKATGKKSITKAAVKPRTKSVAAKSDPHQGHDMSGMKDMPGMDMSGDGKTSGNDMQSMPGMNMPAPASAQPMPDDMQGMKGMEPMPGMPGMDHAATGTALSAGNAPAPAPPTDHYADRAFAPSEMAAARQQLKSEHGGLNHSMVMFNLAEYQARRGGDGFRWDGEGWYGGDINRAVVKTEGEGGFRSGVDSAEVQLLYSRAIDPYFSVQGGVRYDFKPNPSRTYATIGIEGLAPYWFEVEGALFLSNKGDILARAEGYYDQRITQRLILQPRVELNFAAQNVAENRIGSGLGNAELGVRLRYEVRREFAPYVGISYDRKVGNTARFAREDGNRAGSASLVFGVRTWF